MKIWITKYALSKGIYTEDAGCITKDRAQLSGDFVFKSYYGNDWHKTKIDAENRAEEMRLRKIASLKKQLKKMENLTFK